MPTWAHRDSGKAFGYGCRPACMRGSTRWRDARSVATAKSFAKRYARRSIENQIPISARGHHEATWFAAPADEAPHEEAAKEASRFRQADARRASCRALWGIAGMTLMPNDERISISVSYDETKGYVGSHAEIQTTFTALSLNGLRRQIEEALLPEQPIIVLNLDRAARLERDQRRNRIR